ncbi:hypothetical protein H6G80_26945 [Nostoc sp. FACHB-87]|uniref:hypothetical protein n=1 Tax=Nostocaceae TaxID=1162 RepID=UPI001688FFBE|nr:MULTISPECIES: hypothetical protein [Nostocaceae]MBD2457696.1 hypothetical protein [Nostoc sp. FACHB-87]MBD2478841.1 hypothetical protein [Anabaena sp. FACHB-83]
MKRLPSMAMILLISMAVVILVGSMSIGIVSGEVAQTQLSQLTSTTTATPPTFTPKPTNPKLLGTTDGNTVESQSKCSANQWAALVVCSLLGFFYFVVLIYVWTTNKDWKLSEALSEVAIVGNYDLINNLQKEIKTSLNQTSKEIIKLKKKNCANKRLAYLWQKFVNCLPINNDDLKEKLNNLLTNAITNKLNDDDLKKELNNLLTNAITNKLNDDDLKEKLNNLLTNAVTNKLNDDDLKKELNNLLTNAITNKLNDDDLKKELNNLLTNAIINNPSELEKNVAKFETAAGKFNTELKKFNEEQAKPRLVASSSRFLAFIGLIMISGVLLISSFYIVWSLFTCQQLTPLSDLKTYLASSAALFAPYLANKVSEIGSNSKK